MKEVKVVIGANFGDEGKGQMTEYFAEKARKKGNSCIVVCHNGSAQKGHTVVEKDGTRHVFHHFGAGAGADAETYFSKDFYVSPIFFRKEYEELERKGYNLKVYVDPDCRVVLPSDIMINQEIENLRNKNRHGSCGYGFFEAVTRSKREEYLVKVEDLLDLDNCLKKIKRVSSEYVPERCKELGMKELREEFLSLILDEDILSSYQSDLQFFLDHTVRRGPDLLLSYDTVIFESSQGLLLDEDNMEYFPHLTPSHTGLHNPYLILEDLGVNCPVEVCYVTRTYLTRHGAGRLDGECDKKEINPDMVDQTNVPNPFQGTLRYAKLDVDQLYERIEKDFSITRCKGNYYYTIARTHENEYYEKDMQYMIAKYSSYGPTKEDIRKLSEE